MKLPNTDLITILGPTASGKTTIATHLANELEGEVISADSRQVYREMTIGTGKDYNDYFINSKKIKTHLIDIVDPGYEYNVYEYQKDFLKAYNKIKKDKKTPVLCGGSGLYIEAVLKGYNLIRVPVNKKLREKLEKRSLTSLAELLASMKTLHNVTDTQHKKRIIRAIEIEQYYKEHNVSLTDFPKIHTTIFGIKFPRDVTRQRITLRLKKRLSEGMIGEVELLLKKGVTKEKLIYYGLEYKFITMHLSGELTYDEMFQKLNTAIHQFAKRQMTWFRKMERQGNEIIWIDGLKPLEEKVEQIINIITKKKKSSTFAK